MNIIILGSIPPPIGGVSIHVQRLIPYLSKAGYKCIIWNLWQTGICWITRIKLSFYPVWELLKSKNNLIYYPLSDAFSVKRIFPLIFLKFLGAKLVVLFVASSQQTIKNDPIDRLAILIIAKISNHLVSVNKDFAEYLTVNKIQNKKISIISAFIPPEIDAVNRILVPKNIIFFTEQHNPIITTYANGPVLHNGEDLYGIDLIIELSIKLKNDFPKHGIVVVIPEITNKDYFEIVLQKVILNNLEANIHFAIGTHISFVSLLKYSNVFVRATNTDGDGITIREALYFGVPTVVSDVCERPKESIVFQSRNIQDLENKVRFALTNIPKTTPLINNADRLIETFNKVLQRGGKSEG